MKKRIVMLMICGLVIGSVSGCGRSRLDASIAEYNQAMAESTDVVSEDYETAAVSEDIQGSQTTAESEEEYAEPVVEEDTDDTSEELLFNSDNESSDDSAAELFDATAVSETSAETEVSEATAAPAESYDDDAVFISKTSYTAETDTAADTENDFSYDSGCGYGYEYCYDDNLSETENEVLRIRQMYNEIEAGYGDYTYRVSDWGGELLDNGYYQKIVLPVGVDGSMYERRYYYKNHELFFAFYREGSHEHRLYFSNGNLIKWIFDKEDIDKEENWQGWLDWESIALYEGGDLL